MQILSTHKVLGFEVTRFLTRFGEVVWIVSDPNERGHRGVAQGSRYDVAAWMRAEAIRQDAEEVRRHDDFRGDD